MSRVCQAKLVKELFRFSFSYIPWILLRAPRFFFNSSLCKLDLSAFSIKLKLLESN